jgi:hypothetical protein
MRSRGVRRYLPALAIASCMLAALAAYSARRANAQEPPFYAIRNVRIVPVSGPPVANGTVVIVKGLIQSVGASGNIPAEARVIDGTGLTVYPGLIDAGTDVGLGAVAAPAAGAGGRGGGGGGGGRGAATNAPLSRGPEDRPATNPWENAADQLKADDTRMETWRNAGFTTALVIPRNGFFPGQAAIVDYGEADRPEELVVKTPAALPISLNGGRGAYQGFPEALMGDLSYVRQVFIDAKWYAEAEQAYEAHPKGNVRPEYDHTDDVISKVLASDELVMWPGNTDVDIIRALRMAPTLGARWALTGAQQGYEINEGENVPQAIAAAKVPVFIDVNWPAPGQGGGGGRGFGGGGGFGGGDTGDTLRTLRFRDRAPSTPAALNKVGVKFAFTSSGIVNPKDILANVQKSIAAGLPADVALRSLTLGAAEILGVADRTGSIEPGKIANLVVTDGDIFNPATNVRWVFVDGQLFIPPPAEAAPAGRGGGRGAPVTAADLNGMWNMIFSTGDGGTQQSTANFNVAGDGSITGTLNSPLGTATVTHGQMTGNQFRMTISMTMSGSTTDVNLTGTVNGNSLSGTLDFNGYSVDFTGTRPRQTDEGVGQ